MVILLIVLCFFLLLAVIGILIAHTQWAQENAKWLTSFKFYLFVGFLVGVGLIYIGYNFAQSLGLKME